MEEEFDREFMVLVEGNEQKGYVPSKHSGVTIAIGLDLSSQGVGEFS
jgi:hypothetical protein